jgi:amino acid adenylation domain-containing protein
MTERSIEMIIGIFGILKARGAYLPIDPEYPNDRIAYMLTDSASKILVTTQDLSKKIKFEKERIYLSDAINRVPTPPHLHLSPAPATSLAYIIYTSGSTGKPKGVIVEHCSTVNVLSALFKTYPLTYTDRYLLKTSFTFDVSVSELFGWFWGGGGCIILAADHHKDPQKILEAIEYEGITHINFVPSMFGVFIHQLLEKNITKLSGLKYIFLAGEALPPQQVKEFRNLNTLIALENLYGPTEGTIYASGYSLSQWNGNGNVPIGKPLQNVKLYILDSNCCPVPIGVIGELFIAGHGIARGYLNNPELTAERFFFLFHRSYRSYRSYISKKLYQTGDLARWQPDGNIEFLGRKDHQVKIRGFRIELGEIENHLRRHEKVKEAVVLAETWDDGQGAPPLSLADKYLCAYIAAANESLFAHTPGMAEELREYLGRSLPDYMVPLYFIKLDKIPLTTSGKIDRKALPPPFGLELTENKNDAAPGNAIEEKLLEIWSGILGHHVGINDNFFKMGGHSLKATILMSKIYREFNVTVPVIAIFKKPTIRQLAQYIKSAKKEITPIIDDRMVLLKKKPANSGHLFFIHDGTGETEGYIEFCNHLSAQFNCWGIGAPKIENYTPQNLSIQEVAQQYIPKIESLQPHGPYYIAGWSIGGTIAFEMARQLEQQQEKIDFLALIDTWPPDKKLLKQAIEFNRETEVNLINKYFHNKKIKNRLEYAAEININRIWPEILEHLQEKEKKFNIQIIKDSVPQGFAKIIPNFQQISIKELIYYLNMVRTYENARNKYIPKGKINTKIHFFKAGEETGAINAEKWNLYCREPIQLYEIPGHHVSILKKPQVASFAKLFDNVIQGIT